MDITTLYNTYLTCCAVCIDTRKIKPGDMFFAIKGANFDANTFAAEALERGAGAVVIDNEKYLIDQRTICVADALKALQQLASHHRSVLNIPILALTGSNGKTTTKELLHSVLSKKFNTVATVGNLNNHIGVPLTLLSISKETQIAIVEMGANHQQEISFLCNLATPDYGYITNFGKAHLEGFGGVEGVIKGKSEMYDFLFDSGKMTFVNLDDPIQALKSTLHPRFTFGYNNPDADVNILKIEADPFVKIVFDGGTINSQLIGQYNATNICAAIAVGRYFKVTDADIIDALERYSPQNNRSQLYNKGQHQLILDAYNANPSSMVAALEHFKTIHATSKVAILGDMFELGTEAPSEHRIVAGHAAQITEADIYLVGKEFFNTRIVAPNLHYFQDFDSLVQHLSSFPLQPSTILIKGSRGMALERVLDYL